MVPAAPARARIDFVQDVNRTGKGDRLVPLHAAQPVDAAQPVVASSSHRRVKPAASRPAAAAPRLPEGCTSAVSILSDRIAANQASNCITALEVTYKVAAAE
jgi:hypothetical protein